MMSDLELLNSSENNLSWFQKNSSKFQKDYPNKIVAIKEQKIVAIEDNVIELRKKLKDKKIDESLVLIEVIANPNEITIL